MNSFDVPFRPVTVLRLRTTPPSPQTPSPGLPMKSGNCPMDLDVVWDAQTGQCEGIGHVECAVKYIAPPRTVYNELTQRCEASVGHLCTMDEFI